MYLWGLKPGSEPPGTALAGRLRETLTPQKWPKQVLALKLHIRKAEAGQGLPAKQHLAHLGGARLPHFGCGGGQSPPPRICSVVNNPAPKCTAPSTLSLEQVKR